MKTFTFLLFLVFGFNSYSQFNFNSYEKATLKLRNGDVLEGEAKITNEETIKFRNGDDKETFTYRNLKSFTIVEDYEKESYVFKIIAGKTPRLMKIIKEYEGRINLYAIEYKNNNPGNLNSNTSGLNMNTGVTFDVTEFYVNKDGGHEVIKLGNNHPVFGKRHFKNTVHEFFKDCTALMEKVEKNEFKRNDMISIIEFYNDNCGN
jgi:uncharacterized protein involved in tellurium resistance